MSGGDLFQDVLTKHGAPPKGTPGLGEDLVVMVELEQWLLGQQWVQFNLIDHWHFMGLGGQVLQVDHLVVADPDGLGEAGLLQVLKCPPRFKECPLDWPVDKQEIDIVRLELLQLFLD